MPYSIGSVLNTTPADPGWTVTVTSPSSGDPTACPVVCWATVVVGHDAIGQMRTEVQAAFVLDREIWTVHGLNQVIETVYRLNAPGSL
ncbi:hypothetical protein CG740_37105 [Streptomyces sp. CB01201]|uniref:hypothetical protein n=1 Tax=Streptomyces sp. CB01201 TaxID=2020324 RepID=UPI000C27E0BE|nr:hypothetical protein [Streptomyces sp. CB01201]PJM98106.1 hypothetical protein CG740_37105 [Streptomyces sp. CB01201]